MKEFAASLILLVLVITCVTVNAIYVKNTSQQIKDLALDVFLSQGEAEESKAIEALNSKWEASRQLLAVSISLREIDDVTEYIIRLECAKQDGDETELGRVYHLLCNSIDDAVRYERLSLHTIF